MASGVWAKNGDGWSGNGKSPNPELIASLKNRAFRRAKGGDRGERLGTELGPTGVGKGKKENTFSCRGWGVRRKKHGARWGWVVKKKGSEGFGMEETHEGKAKWSRQVKRPPALVAG